MKHAIIMLSEAGADYLNKNIEQFENDSDIDLYIHIDKKTLEERNQIIIKDNIKFCENLHNSDQFGTGLCNVIFDLLKIANTNFEYDYYHLFDEYSFITVSINEFKNFFKEENSYINYLGNFDNFYIEENNINEKIYYGLQWFSLYKDIVKEILNKEERFNYYLDSYNNGKLHFSFGAIVEIIFSTLIIKDICSNNNDIIKEKHINYDNLRYVKWLGDKFSILLKSLDYTYDIDEIKNKKLIVRKINYKVKDSLDFLISLKKESNNLVKKFNLPFDAIFVLCYAGDNARYELMKKTVSYIGRENITHFIFTTPMPSFMKPHLDEIVWDGDKRGQMEGNEEFSIRMFSGALNHYTAIKTAYELGYNRILILEDDIEFINNDSLIKQTFDMVNDEHPFIKFSTQTYMFKDKKTCLDLFDFRDNGIQEITNQDHITKICGAAGYTLNRFAMELMIKACNKKTDTPDGDFGYIDKDNIYLIKYPILQFSEECSNSNIDLLDYKYAM